MGRQAVRTIGGAGGGVVVVVVAVVAVVVASSWYIDFCRESCSSVGPDLVIAPKSTAKGRSRTIKHDVMAFTTSKSGCGETLRRPSQTYVLS